MTTFLSVEALSKSYGSSPVVDNISFSLDRGEIGCLLGPSGCGKTTLLRSIAGFENIESGSIVLDGEIVSGQRFVPAERRRIGMVFQDYALFPHLTVARNVAFGLSGLNAAQIARTVDSLLETVGLTNAGSKYPHELSGGQQQRVALARALAPEPRLLLMDEPFSNLDVSLRESLSMEVRSILKERGTTALLVTHNQQEAYAMADRIGVIACGTMHQWDTPLAVYHRPASTEVAGFVGEGSLIVGKVSGNILSCALGEFSSESLTNVSAIKVLVRPEDILPDEASPFQAQVVGRTFRGSSILYSLRLETGEVVLAQIPSHHDHSIGHKIGIRTDLKHLVVFPGSATLQAQECVLE
ncbi:MAG: iron ABC transporter ATP-binding protein [Deltaproteobacteria bacterium HGW-Deltaproteobacteria-18]|jgi:iron(III) transport system ATP-binding protein|nr:MAG: iron ABC transporter ATP-binding protein [Deltaproteobacteria bacterium HGW-Deltaproteobacteria-18]